MRKVSAVGALILLFAIGYIYVTTRPAPQPTNTTQMIPIEVSVTAKPPGYIMILPTPKTLPTPELAPPDPGGPRVICHGIVMPLGVKSCDP